MGIANTEYFFHFPFDFSQAKEGFPLDQNDLIQRIIATEHQAQAITQNARSEHAHMDERIDAELAALRQRYAREEERYLETLRQKAEAESTQRLTVLEQRLQEKLSQIESIYSTQKDNWVEAIFRQIVGKDGG